MKELAAALKAIVDALDAIYSLVPHNEQASEHLAPDELELVAKLEGARIALIKAGVKPLQDLHDITVQALEDEIAGEKDYFLPTFSVQKSEGHSSVFWYRLKAFPTMEFQISVDVGHNCTVYASKEMGQDRQIVTFVNSMQDFHSKMLMIHHFVTEGKREI